MVSYGKGVLEQRKVTHFISKLEQLLRFALGLCGIVMSKAHPHLALFFRMGEKTCGEGIETHAIGKEFAS